MDQGKQTISSYRDEDKHTVRLSNHAPGTFIKEDVFASPGCHAFYTGHSDVKQAHTQGKHVQVFL